jgi:hypothetical protein
MDLLERLEHDGQALPSISQDAMTAGFARLP